MRITKEKGRNGVNRGGGGGGGGGIRMMKGMKDERERKNENEMNTVKNEKQYDTRQQRNGEKTE